MTLDRYRIPWLGMAALALFCTCGGSVEVEIAPSSLSEAEFASAYAAANCTFGACCDRGGLVADPTCRAEVETDIRAQLDTAHAAGASFDEVAASACVDEVRTAAAACPTFKSIAFDRSKCWKVFVGKPKPAGEPCSTNWECADEPSSSGACITTISAAGSDSRCGPVLVVEEDEPCEGFSEGVTICRAPFACFPSDGICYRRPGADESCPTGPATGDLCIDGYVCDRNASKQCVRAKQAGEACSAPEECELFSCREGRCAWTGENLFPRACQKP